jgi:hypothetical protein
MCFLWSPDLGTNLSNEESVPYGATTVASKAHHQSKMVRQYNGIQLFVPLIVRRH